MKPLIRTRPRFFLGSRILDLIDARPVLTTAILFAGLAALLIRVSGVSL